MELIKVSLAARTSYEMKDNNIIPVLKLFLCISLLLSFRTM